MTSRNKRPPRVVHEEILDQLTEEDPEAVRNRREILWINHFMGNFRWLATTLSGELSRTDKVLEIGAGDGTLRRHLDRKGAVNCSYDGLDVVSRPQSWPESSAWHASDLQTFGGYQACTCIVGNLILHQFTDEQLRALAPRLRATARLLIFNEPHRSRLTATCYRIASRPLLGRVSRHDGEVSIRAGFVAGELPELLGLSEAEWSTTECTTLLGAYRMLAIRK